MTVLPELLPISIEMVRTCSSSCVMTKAVAEPPSYLLGLQAERKLTGIMNFTNPGAISHNEIMELYKQYIDPEFSWQNFTVEEQAKVIKAPRSNNLLDTKRASGCVLFAASLAVRKWGLILSILGADCGRIPRTSANKRVLGQICVRA